MLDELYLWMLIILIIAIVLAVLFSTYVFSSIALPVKKITDALAILALGEKMEKMTVKGNNEIGTLMESFNKLSEVQNNISSAANKVAKGNTSIKLLGVTTSRPD